MELITMAGSALLIGLLGSLHCVGMCGPLAVAVGAAGKSGAGRRLLLWLLGKGLTYLILGVAAGTIGSAFGGPGLGQTGLGILGIVAGTGMMAIGGAALWRRVRPQLSGSPGPVGTLMQSVLGARHPLAPLAVGSLTGLLPCGLVYAMVTQALATGSAFAGGVVMLSFGVGTAPSLLAMGWSTRLLTGRTRRWGEAVAALAVVVMGLIVLWRGISYLASPDGAPDCCGGV
jgi:uncharacterized protein